MPYSLKKNMQLSIDSIKIRKRIRRDMGDLNSLMRSLHRYGQFSPILIDPEYRLIAGHRRLEAAKKLGWRTVEVIIVEDDSDLNRLEIELEENMQRKNLSSDEISDGLNALQKLRNPGIFRRIINFFKRLFKRLFKKKRR